VGGEVFEMDIFPLFATRYSLRADRTGKVDFPLGIGNAIQPNFPAFYG
jgi:hypothetical protein